MSRPLAAILSLVLVAAVDTGPLPHASGRPDGSGPGCGGGFTAARGDTLWSIAADALGPDAAAAEIDAAWRVVATANRGVVDDPDLIFPGTELAMPPLPHRKEPS